MEPDGKSPIALNLTLDTVNQILAALGARPYDQVANLITNIQQQAVMQLQAKKEAMEKLND